MCGARPAGAERQIRSAQPLEQRLAGIDTRLAAIFNNRDDYVKPRDLHPFPLLGLPGWDKNNERESYYDNSDYFRPGRARKLKG